MPDLLAVHAAQKAITAHMPQYGSEQVALHLAHGRVLRQRVVSEREQPPFDRVMMDGIAIHWQQSLPATFNCIGAQFAGESAAALTAATDCIEVATGAVLPDGCDCVIPVEQTTRDGQIYRLRDGATAASGQFIHRRGTDSAAGEVVLQAGVRIGPAEVGLLAANGVANVEVAISPRIALLVTGDELVDVDAPLRPAHIRRSNDAALRAAFQLQGLCEISTSHLRDDVAALHAALTHALMEHDVLILSGGVSMGQRDHVPSVLQSLGVQQVFHRVAQRPGKPMWFGVVPNGPVVFALPGNPVSALVCATRYVRPALHAAMGLQPKSPEYVVLEGDVPTHPDLTCFVPVRVQSVDTGALTAYATGTRNSGDFTSLAGTQGFVELPAGDAAMPAGAVVPLHRWW